MAEHLVTSVGAGANFFTTPGQWTDLWYDASDGTRYQVHSASPSGTFSLDGSGRLVMSVVVGGNKLLPGAGSWVSFSDTWDYEVTASEIWVKLGMNPIDLVSEGGTGWEAAAFVADLSSSDADNLNKFVNSGRTARANALLGDILS